MQINHSTNSDFSLFLRRSPPVILQAEAAECGLACLAMVLSFHGHRTSLSELRRRFSMSLKGATLQSVMNMADAMGLSARPLRLELDEIPKLKFPAVLHWDLNHYVVLAGSKRGRFVIHDPARGARLMTLAEMSSHFTGIALELTPTPSLSPKPKAERARISELFGHVRGVRAPIIQLFILAAISQVFSLASPMLNQAVVDNAIARGDMDLLTTIAVGMSLLLIFGIVTNILRGFINIYLGNQLSFQMQTNLLRHTLRLPADWYEKRHVGDILSRLSSLSPIQNVFTSSAISVALDGLMATAALLMMVVYAPLLTTLECVSITVSFIIRMAAFPYIRNKTEQSLQISAKVQTTLLETIRGARTFKLFGAERERIAVWQNEQAGAINNSVDLARFGIWGGSGSALLAGIQQLIIWYIGARMVIEGKMTLGMLVAYQAYASQFTGAAAGIIGQIFNYRTMGLHLERLADIVHATPEQSIDTPIDPDRTVEGAIELRNVSFRYAEHESWLLRDINLKIQAGEFACLAGPSGHGKTTLLKMLVGFSVPGEGEILVDGVPIRTLGIRTLRSQIGVVMQDDQLFSGTIADNIAFFDPEADQPRVEEAARMAQIHDDIVRLPMGYLALVGDMGTTLSGGQRQRVLLARALYRRPRILFLDEGTANLDADSERRVMDVVRALPITRVVVAHRLGAQKGADRLFWVEGGSIHERSDLIGLAEV